MTKTRFIELCDTMLLDPLIVLELDDIRNALKARDDKRVEELMREEF